MAERTGERVPVEELLEFPTVYSFKAIGHHTREFSERCHRLAREALGGDRRVELRTRLSRQGTYLSATLTARIETAEELKEVYRVLRQVDGLITLL
ncbi:MAG: DUF493 domain-containing protein [Thermodesulfobacteriota bacterium]|jgi:putative lipoic acid-binding regulatory protein